MIDGDKWLQESMAARRGGSDEEMVATSRGAHGAHLL